MICLDWLQIYENINYNLHLEKNRTGKFEILIQGTFFIFIENLLKIC